MSDVGGHREGGRKNRTGGQATHPRRIEAQQRVAKALALRIQGVAYSAIAEQCGYKNGQRAHEAVKRAIVALPKDKAIEARTVELERLDRLMLTAWEKAISGDTGAGDYILRIMKRRAALAGLDAPVKAQVDNTGTTTLRWEDAEPYDKSEPDQDATPPSGPTGGTPPPGEI